MSIASVTLATSLLALAATPRVATADSCTPAKVMVVLDKSSSMQTGSIGGQTKWNIAVNALGGVLSDHQSKAEFGLMTFPQPNECGPGELDVSPALDSRANIMSALSTPPPTGGNWTPMAQTLDAAGAEPSLAPGEAPRYVILISDGWQYCIPYSSSTRFDGVDSVTDLAAQGITTYVVGFGASVDSAALNQMAVQAGTARTGCNPANDDPADANQCYFQANNAAELSAALDLIVGTVTEEVCDGIDNDCDGLVDEALTRGCSTACGAGAETCSAGTWIGCDAPAPTAETCDGIDNNCDGTTDPGCECEIGETRSCGAAGDQGACSTGMQTCNGNGTWGSCDGAAGPSGELCDGIDNDCDGTVDEYDAGEVGDLCGSGEVCMNGGCEPVDPGTPPDEGPAGDGEVASGCGCASGDVGAGGVLPLFLVVGILVMRRRRA